MKKVFLLGLCLLALSLSIQAQNKGRIYGKMQDKLTKESLPFVNIVLLKASDSSQVKGASSDERGDFSFQNMANGTYILKASSLGYDFYQSNTLIITSQNSNIQLGVVEMNPSSTNLETVVVQAKKNFIEQLPGKMVMNVANNPTTEVDNALELLKKMPGVFVDKDDAISLNGKGGVLVMIDNRPTYTSGTELANLLRSMSASEIETIETIDRPSAKYDAEGVSGIINLKTKKNNNIGFNGSVNAGAGYSGSWHENAGLKLSYRGKHIGVNAAGDFYGQTQKAGFELEQGFSDGTILINKPPLNEKWGQKGAYNGGAGKVGLDYYINDNHTIGFSFRQNAGRYNQIQNINTLIIPPIGSSLSPNTSDFYIQNTDYSYLNTNSVTNINYQANLDTGLHQKILSLDFAWVRNGNTSNGIDHFSYYLPSDHQNPSHTDGYTLWQPLISNIFSAKLDYEQGLGKKASFEAGAKYSWVENNNIIAYHVENVYDSNRSNRYIYKENIASIYGIFHYDFTDKTKVQIGLRGEYTHSNGYSPTLDSNNQNHYFNVFPNINISQGIGEKHRLNLGYSYRLSRPYYGHLNPFAIQQTANSIRYGNPYLKPEYTHNLAFDYSFNYMIFASLSYRHGTGGIESVSYYNDSSLMISSLPENAGKSNTLNLSLNGQFTILKIWQCTPFVQAYYGKMNMMYRNKNENTSVWGGSFWIDNNITFAETWIINVGGWMSLPGKEMFSKSRTMWSVDMGIKKSFLNKTLQVSLSIDDIFNMNSYRAKETYPDGSYESMNYYWQGRTVNLSLRYKFGNENAQLKQRKSSSVEETDRLGGGGGGKGGR